MTAGPRGEDERPLNSFSADWAAATQLGGGGWIDKVGVQALVPSPPSSPSLPADDACRWSGGTSPRSGIAAKAFPPRRKSWGQLGWIFWNAYKGTRGWQRKGAAQGVWRPRGSALPGKFWLSIN